MKKTKQLTILILSIIGLMSINDAKAQKITNEDWSKLSRYNTDNKTLKANDRVVFMGNSITEFWVKTDSLFFSQNKYIGRGISGQATPQFLTRFREDVIELKPQIVIINGGINDIAENTGTFDPNYTLGCIKSMAELSKANGIKVILTSILPAFSIPWDDNIKNVPQKIESLNKQIKEYAERNGYGYVDYYSQMVTPNKAMIAEYTTDGVHVTIDGYKVMEALVKNKIDEFLMLQNYQ